MDDEFGCTWCDEVFNTFDEVDLHVYRKHYVPKLEAQCDELFNALTVLCDEISKGELAPSGRYPGQLYALAFHPRGSLVDRTNDAKVLLRRINQEPSKPS